MNDREKVQAHIDKVLRSVGEKVAQHIEEIPEEERVAKAERWMISESLRQLADRIESGLTVGFTLTWEKGGTAEGTEMIFPPHPAEVITIQLINAGENDG